jgi:hypothetical protein
MGLRSELSGGVGHEVNSIPKGVTHITAQTTFFNIKMFKNQMNSARFAIELG